jgi:predicted dehydrogenase
MSRINSARMAKAISVGIIGLGVMGQRMLARLEAHPRVRARAAWDERAEIRAVVQKQYPALIITRDGASVATTRGVDVLYIATPPATHLEYAERGFDAGLAVLSEKPLTIDIAAARRTTARIEREGLKNAVNFSLASSPGLAALEAAMKDGSIGTPERIEIEASFARWPRAWQEAAGSWLAERREGGFTREVLSHFIFVAQRLLGLARIDSTKVDYPPDAIGAERALAARLTAGGLPVTISGRVGGSHPDFNRLTLVGSSGAVELHDWFGVRRRSGSGDWTLLGSPEENRALGQNRQLDQLVAMVLDRPHTLPSFAEALEVQRTVEALLRG